MRQLRSAATVFLFCVWPLWVSATDELASWSDLLSGTEQRSGLLELHIDSTHGRLLAEIPANSSDGTAGRYIYQAALARGLGSNPVGLDRTFGNQSQIVAIRQVGKRVLFEAENWDFRAEASAAERRAVSQSFARSVLWATDVLARHADGRVLINLSGFATRDAIGIASQLKQAEQGDFSLDTERSVIETDNTLTFPDNVEFEATLTFASTEPGTEVRQTAPDPTAVSLVLHHSLIRLPDDDFERRTFDHRVGGIELPFYDYSSPLSARLSTKLAIRHRLKSTSDGVAEPIVYYLDPGAPEPIRGALLDGARWWQQAFEAAGFNDAYRVELLPENVHPLDARYNVITWVHRATRGWSYGGSIVDPRSGEIVRGYVLLGSQRIRQDRLIFEGLAGRENTGTGTADDPLELALARIRQLAAHEVGHTLGIAHNFAASMNDRASVMDYPAPWVLADEDGGLDFSQAYDVGLGDWDVFTVRWLYQELENDTDAQLNQLVEQSQRDGLLYISDGDGRGVGTAHPKASVWDNANDAVSGLEQAWQVREIALTNFGPDRIANGEDQSQLQRVLVPIYLYHRYQVAAAAKLVGGIDFDYRKRGDAGKDPQAVPAAEQKRALTALLRTIEPAALDLPDTLLDQLTPFNPGFSGIDAATRRELFSSATGPAFDPSVATSVAASMTIDALLHPARAARLVEQHRRDNTQLNFGDVLQALDGVVFAAARREPTRIAATRDVVKAAYIDALITLALDPAANNASIAQADAHLNSMSARLARGTDHDRLLAARISRHQQRQAQPLEPNKPVPTPPGSPIGAAESCWHCGEY